MKKILFFIFTLLSFHPAHALDQLTIILDWFPNPHHAPLLIAQQKGFFKEKNLDVKFIGPVDPTDAVKWVAAGKANIGLTYQPQFLKQVDQGLPLVRIGTLIDKPLDCIIALKESGIHKITDLKGKRIGSSADGLDSMMLKSMLNSHGLSTQDVELINVRYNLTQALLSHKVDAVTGIMRNFEIPQIESTGKAVTVFLPEDNQIPNYSVLIFIARLDQVEDNRFPRFLDAIKKGVAYLDRHPQETWEAFAKAYPESNNAVNHGAWFATMPYFAENPAHFDPVAWQRFAEFMQKNHMIKKIQPMSRYAVNILDTGR